MPVMIGFVVSFLSLRSRSLLIGLWRLYLYPRFRLPLLNAVQAYQNCLPVVQYMQSSHNFYSLFR